MAVLDPSLLVLSKLRAYGGWRKFKRRLLTPKGFLFMLAGLALIGLMLAGNLVQRPGATVSQGKNLLIHPAVLFGYWVITSIGSRAKSPIAFSLAEVDFLFPGPYSRRQLLLYKLLLSSLGSLGFAVMMPLFAGRYLEVWWPVAFLGLWWALLFLQLSTTAVTLFFDWLGARGRLWRNLAIALVAVLIALSAWQTGVLTEEAPLSERFLRLTSAPGVQTLLAPFVVFNRMIAATSLLAALGWGAAALGVNLLMVLVILRLDANFLEASLAASQRRYEIQQRAMRGGGIPAIRLSSKPRFSLPQFPRALGAGPVAWQQALQLWRGSGRLVYLLPALLAPLIGVVTAGRAENAAIAGVAVFTTFFIAFMTTTVMPLGLRTDLEHVDTLKSLPISPTSVVCGSLIPAMLYIAAVQLLAIGAMVALTGGWSSEILAILAFVPPFNLMLIGIDSILVLLFPQIRNIQPNDPTVGVRMFLVYLAKMFFIALLTAIAVFYGFAGYVLLGELPAVAFVAGWLALTAEGLVMLWFVALLFHHMDPSGERIEGD